MNRLAENTYMPSNPFTNNLPGLNGPALDMIPVTPSDSVELATVAVSLYITAAGTVRFKAVSGETRTVSVPAFYQLPCGVRQVFVTGTTATGIHAYVVG